MADYESGWVSIVELQTGAEVSQKLDNAFANVDDGLEAITANTNELASLEPVFLVDKVQDVNIASAGQWYDIGQIAVAENVAADYLYAMSMTFTLSTTVNDASFRFSTNDGLTWNEWSTEPKDSSTKYPVVYMFPYNRALDAGLNLRLQAMKTGSGDTMTINFADVWIEKKLNTPIVAP